MATGEVYHEERRNSSDDMIRSAYVLDIGGGRKKRVDSYCDLETSAIEIENEEGERYEFFNQLPYKVGDSGPYLSPIDAISIIVPCGTNRITYRKLENDEITEGFGRFIRKY